MEYIVDKRKRKQVTRDVRKRLGAKVIIPRMIWIIMFIALALVTIVCLRCVLEGALAETEDQFFTFFSFAVPIVLGVFLLSIIPLCLRSFILRKYMMPWCGLKQEEVVLEDKAITHRFVNLFWQGYMEKYWWTFKIRYRQVLRIEYDEYQHLLRVYGPTESRQWQDSKYTQCISKVGANPEWKDQTWLNIPDYFENFEELKKELETRTGLTTINKVRPFDTYK